MKRRFLFPSSVLALVTLAAVGSGACSKSSDPGQGGDGTVTIAAGVTSLDAAHADDVGVQSGKLIFPTATHPEIAGLAAGAVLVGEPGVSAATPNPFGFLRKVVSVSDDGNGNTVVTTEQGTLLDLVDEGELSGTLTVPDTDPAATTASTKSLHTKGGAITLLDLSGKTLFQNSDSVTVNGKQIGYAANVTLTTGSLKFTPKFDVGAKITPKLTLDIKKLVSEAHVIATGTLDASATIDASLKLTNTGVTGADIAALIANKIAKSSNTTIADKTIPLPSLKLGPINVPAHARFTASVSCDFKWGGETRVVFGETGSVTVKAGAQWDGSNISPVWDHSETMNQVGPNWTISDDVLLKCSITPHFELSLWDVASGEVTASAYASLSAQATCNGSTLTGDVAGQAFAGANATAKATLDVFGLFKWQKECTLFDVHTPVAQTSGSIPLGSGATCTPQPAPSVPAPVTAPGASCFGDTSTGGDDAGTDSGSLADGAPVMCSHDACVTGDVLTTGCTLDHQGGACIAAICAKDSYCCTSGWTLSCVQHLIDGDIPGCAPNICE